MTFNIAITVLFYLFYMATVIYSYFVKWKKWNLYAIVSFTLLMGLRGNGIDYFAYKALFEHLVSLDYGLFDSRFYLADFYWSVQNFEWFYLVIIKIAKTLNVSSVFFFSVIAFAQIYFLDALIRNFKKIRIKLLLVFFFFTTLMFVESFNVMRQILAILAYVNIIPYLAERNYKKYFLFCAALYLLHSSSLLLMPLYFLNKDFLKKESIQFLCYFIAVVFSFFFKEKIGQLFDFLFAVFSHNDYRLFAYFDMSKDKIVHQSEYTFKLTTFFFRTLVFSYLVLNGRKLKDMYGTYGVFLFNMVFIGFIVQEFVFGINIQRLNYYFYYLSFIILALITDMNLQEGKKNAKIFSYVILAVYLIWFINSVYGGAGGCAPYALSEAL